MKKMTYLLILIAIITTTCKKECKYDSYSQIEPCGKNETCVNNIEIIDIQNTEFTYNSQYIITNDSIYTAIKKLDSINVINWPDINFEKEILIGKYTESTGCSLNTSYKLTKVDNEYLLSIRNISHGNCDKLIIKTHWLIIPKIDSSTINFKIINNEC